MPYLNAAHLWAWLQSVHHLFARLSRPQSGPCRGVLLWSLLIKSFPTPGVVLLRCRCFVSAQPPTRPRTGPSSSCQRGIPSSRSQLPVSCPSFASDEAQTMDAQPAPPWSAFCHGAPVGPPFSRCSRPALLAPEHLDVRTTVILFFSRCRSLFGEGPHRIIRGGGETSPGPGGRRSLSGWLVVQCAWHMKYQLLRDTVYPSLPHRRTSKPLIRHCPRTFTTAAARATARPHDVMG